MSIAHIWGATADERARPYPCDRWIDHADASYFRAVTVRAPAGRVFRWLCQLRVAPYSYDWIDNGGRRSPRALTPGADDLALGQPVMRIFQLVEFETGRHLTLRLPPGRRAARRFGEVAVTYLVEPRGPESCRLVAKVAIRYRPGFAGAFARWFLPWGDLVMMRRQLLNLRALAEAPSGEG